MSVLVMLSGGLDSAVVLAKVVNSGATPVRALHFTYDHPARNKEWLAAVALCKHYRVADYDRLIEPPLSGVMCGAGPGSPVVTGRNTIMLANACALAQALGLREVHIGVSGEDESLFPDCRPGYIAAMNTVQQKVGGPRIVAPLLGLSRAEVRQLAAKLDVPRRLTWSCYFPSREGEPCGECLSCKQDTQ